MRKSAIVCCVLIVVGAFAMGAKRTRVLSLEDRVRNLERIVSVLGGRAKSLDKRVKSLDKRVGWLEDNCIVAPRSK